MKQLYSEDRSLLTHSERKHFNLPIEQRLKRCNDHLQTWIELVELILEKANKDQQKITKWFGNKRNITVLVDNNSNDQAEMSSNNQD